MKEDKMSHILEAKETVHQPAREVELKQNKVTILELTKGKIRDEPVKDELLKKLQKSAAETGGISRIEITSGGQLSRNAVLKRSGGKSTTKVNGKKERLGKTTNHDHGNAADFIVFDMDNKIIRPDNPANEKLLTKFSANMFKNGFTNVGAGNGYMGGIAIHAGIGANKNIWGKGGKRANAPDWLIKGQNKALSGGFIKAKSLPVGQRDRIIRTIIGEGAGESDVGQAAIAHVIFNRVNAKGFGNDIMQVTGAPLQFSAWNEKDNGGNALVRKHGPNSPLYKQVGVIVDGVVDGEILDPTGGATHYFAPKAMKNNQPPIWWNVEKNKAGGSISIGNHVFAGDPAKANLNPAKVNVANEYSIDYDAVNRGTTNPFDLRAQEQENARNQAEERYNNAVNNGALNAQANNLNMILAYQEAMRKQLEKQSNQSIINEGLERIERQTSQALANADQF
jgi:hypothetical protein